MSITREKYHENVDQYLVGDIQPDAGLNIIKEKQREIIQKQRKTLKEYLWRRKEMLDLERKEMSIRRRYFVEVTESNRQASHREKLNKEDKEKQIENLVNNDPSAKGIYQDIHKARESVGTFEMILKNNKMISDRVENMLNAQINLDRMGGKQ